MRGLANGSLASSWGERLGKQRRSGLSIAEFCRQEGVSAASFYAWRRRLQGMDSVRPRPPMFVPVALAAAEESARGVRIELPGGVILSLPADAPLELVTMTIRAVVSSIAAEASSC